MGIDTSTDNGWLHNRGLRILAGGLRLELDWPRLAAHPNYGLVRPPGPTSTTCSPGRPSRRAHGLLENCNVTGPILDPRTSRITGVTAKLSGDHAQDGETEFHAPLVVAADGNSTRLSIAMGLHKREDRPMGVAYRAYYKNPRHTDDYLESWLELTDAKNPDKLLPGYGWIFGMGDGTSNIGLGILNTSTAFQLRQGRLPGHDAPVARQAPRRSGS